MNKAYSQARPKLLPPEERIATFDQDGTLWVERPMYTQVVYCVDRVSEPRASSGRRFDITKAFGEQRRDGGWIAAAGLSSSGRQAGAAMS